MGSLEGKVALVTGASRGIGRAIALEMARAGARVAVNYRNGEAEARAVAKEIAALHRGDALEAAQIGATAGGRELEAESATFGEAKVATRPRLSNGHDAGAKGGEASGNAVMLLKADVSDAEEARVMVEKVIEHWGQLDILVNNAGITRDKTLRKLSDTEWRAVIDTNLNSVFYCTSAAVPAMIRQTFGRIVNISSVIGQTGNIGQANYAAAKGGIIAFTKSAALELAKFNITVNAIAPGFTATEMVNAIPEEVQGQIKGKIPLGRFAQPEEIAKAALFLVRDGDYVTGHQLNVNGGIYL